MYKNAWPYIFTYTSHYYMIFCLFFNQKNPTEIKIVMFFFFFLLLFIYILTPQDSVSQPGEWGAQGVSKHFTVVTWHSFRQKKKVKLKTSCT